MVDSNTLYNTQKIFCKNLLDGTCQEVTTTIDIDAEPHSKPDYKPYHVDTSAIKDIYDIASLYPTDAFVSYCDDDISGIEYLTEYYEKRRERIMGNKVLDLWFERQRGRIFDEYDEKEKEFMESNELVIKYKEIIDRFENELEELYRSEENVEKNYIKNGFDAPVYKYRVDYNKLRNEFQEEFIEEREEKSRKLLELDKEINAQLSLSNDLEYQVDVLTRYGILDKKTKKMVD